MRIKSLAKKKENDLINYSYIEKTSRNIFITLSREKKSMAETNFDSIFIIEIKLKFTH